MVAGGGDAPAHPLLRDVAFRGQGWWVGGRLRFLAGHRNDMAEGCRGDKVGGTPAPRDGFRFGVAHDGGGGDATPPTPRFLAGHRNDMVEGRWDDRGEGMGRPCPPPRGMDSRLLGNDGNKGRDDI